MKIKFYHGTPIQNMNGILADGKLLRGCLSIQRERAISYARGRGAVFCFIQEIKLSAYAHYLFTRLLNQLCRIERISDWIHDHFEGVGCDFEFMITEPLSLNDKSYMYMDGIFPKTINHIIRYEKQKRFLHGLNKGN